MHVLNGVYIAPERDVSVYFTAMMQIGKVRKRSIWTILRCIEQKLGIPDVV